MSICIITIGIPASGKTTWARQYAQDNKNSVVVSRDDIRLAHGWKSGFSEDRVTNIHRAQMEAAFLEGMDVVVADTNINPTFRNRLIKFCHEFGVDVILSPFPISQDEAVMRDAKRANKVGPDVIAKFYNDLKKQNISAEEEILPAPKAEPYKHSTDGLWKHDCVVVDIDGTVAKAAHRGPYDESKVYTDEPHEDVIRIVESLSYNFDIVFASGRKDSCREDTVRWIEKYISLDEYELFMRKDGDKRPDYLIKTDIYDNNIIPKWNIRMVFDDRDQVVRHVRARGITVAQVRPGRF